MAEQSSCEPYVPEEKKTYKKIPQQVLISFTQTKQKLIKKVLVEGKKIASIARGLRLNESTAKMIIQRYKIKQRERQQRLLDLPVEPRELLESKTRFLQKETHQENCLLFVNLDWYRYCLAQSFPQFYLV